MIAFNRKCFEVVITAAEKLMVLIGLLELQVKLDEVEQMALKGGKKELHKLEGRVSSEKSSVCFIQNVRPLINVEDTDL